MTQTEDTLAARLRSLVSLAPSVAHDVRGALNAIRLTVEVMARVDEATRSVEEMERRLAVLRREAERLDVLVAGFLELVSPQDPAATADPLALARQTLQALEPLARQRGVTFSLGEAGGLPRRLTDPERCRQALLDAGIRAAEAGPPGARILVDMLPDPPGVRISVGSAVATLAGRGDQVACPRL